MTATEPVVDKKQRTSSFVSFLRESIINAFEELEEEGSFERTRWEHHSGGGGEIGLLRGKVFEKAAVNFSEVWGPSYPMDDAAGSFYATGISLITHMQNPHAPTVHMNIRYIETEEGFWFGGGYDLTPMGFPYEEDTSHFHQTAKDALAKHGEELYETFSENARNYFYIPHRKKERGVGGIFFDRYYTGDWDKDLAMWKEIGSTFLDAIIPIYKRRIHMPYTGSDKETQLQNRGHYVEFNLIYDRGTKFGFQSGGNPEAILCSMPPIVRW